MKRVVNICYFVATSVALGVTLLDCAWWLALGKRGRAFSHELDWYFADEHSRLLAILAGRTSPGGQAA